MKNKYYLKFKQYNFYMERKENLFIFFLLLLGVIAPMFSGVITSNFWYYIN